MNHQGQEGHEGTRRAWLLSAFGALAVFAWAQGTASPGPQVVPVDQEPMHKLVFENEYVRVFSVEVSPGGETKYHRHERDYVSVMLGGAEVESVRLGEAAKAFKFTDGETLFTKGGFAHKAVNKGEKPFRNVTVELKQGSGASITKGDLVWDPIGYIEKPEITDSVLNQGLYVALLRDERGIMSLNALKRLKQVDGVLLIAVAEGRFIDHGPEPGMGAGCPCPRTKAMPGDLRWGKTRGRFRYLGPALVVMQFGSSGEPQGLSKDK